MRQGKNVLNRFVKFKDSSGVAVTVLMVEEEEKKCRKLV